MVNESPNLTAEQAHKVIVEKGHRQWKDLSKAFITLEGSRTGRITKKGLRDLLLRFILPMTEEEFNRLWRRSVTAVCLCVYVSICLCVNLPSLAFSIFPYFLSLLLHIPSPLSSLTSFPPSLASFLPSLSHFLPSFSHFLPSLSHFLPSPLPCIAMRIE